MRKSGGQPVPLEISRNDPTESTFTLVDGDVIGQRYTVYVNDKALDVTSVPSGKDGVYCGQTPEAAINVRVFLFTSFGLAFFFSLFYSFSSLFQQLNPFWSFCF